VISGALSHATTASSAVIAGRLPRRLGWSERPGSSAAAIGTNHIGENRGEHSASGT
jgi:hypothetical protein